MAKPVALRFLDLFLSGPGLSPAIHTLRDSDTPVPLPDTVASSPAKGLLVIRDAPPGLEWEPGAGWALRRANMYPGFRMVLKGCLSMDTYLEQQLSSKRRAGIRRYRQRLEQSFNIRYTVYYGTIPEEEYQRLFDYLESFIRKRFEAKNAENDQMSYLPGYREQLAWLIRDKKAICQAIYSGRYPVYISFNLLVGNGVQGLINGFDPDYTRFCPGFTGLIHLGQWALEGGFGYIDLLKGDLEYKRLFANQVYPYQAVIAYRKASAGQRLVSLGLQRMIGGYYVLLARGKTLGLHHYYRRWKAMRRGGRSHAMREEGWRRQEAAGRPENLLEPIPLDPGQGHPFRKALFEHLYATGERYSEVQVHQIDEATYFVVGPKGTYRFDRGKWD